MSRFDAEITPLDEAARAGWLYYIGGMTQDQIATHLGVSRQRAQRLVARAMAEGLIRVRLDHKIGACLKLEDELSRRFGLSECRVAPAMGASVDPSRAIAVTAAQVFEQFLAQAEPMVIGVGTGRALRAMADELQPISGTHHRFVSLIGNIASDGSASFFDVILKVAEKLQAAHYPMPVPVISDSIAEREAFHALKPVQAVLALARGAGALMVGVGQMGLDAPLMKDGFISAVEMTEAQAMGAVGEVVGNIFDADGCYLKSEITARMGGVRIEPGLTRPAVGIAAGISKVPAIIGALRGRIINGLITDETTAEALLAHP
jgi:DNA-binding transcriptional regulator LsrR (DeoR family)